MLDIVLQILSVLGIILLVLLGVLLTALLLVLFFPVTYRISGEKEENHLEAAARANWLFGLLRVRFVYPEPGKLTAKFLFCTIYERDLLSPAHKPHSEGKDRSDSTAKDGRADSPEEDKTTSPNAERPEKKNEQGKSKAAQSSAAAEDSRQYEKEKKPEADEEKHKAAEENPKAVEENQVGGEAASENDKKVSRFSEKFIKIKYKICGIYDKIKKIWQNITYYVELLRAEESRLLFRHVNSRLWKILKSLRPRKLKAQVLFGTGAPDTTGYAYGIYGMLQALLGPEVIVTPDFQQARLEGRFFAAGHLIIAVLLWHLLRVLLDRRLWRFWNGLKKGLKPAKSAG